MNTAKADNSYIQLVYAFPLVPLRTEAQFDEAVKMMKDLARRLPSLTQGETDYLAVLGDLIKTYESKLPSIDATSTPQEILKYLMERNGLTQSDLVEYVGYKSNLSAFFSGNRELSKRAATRLAEFFKVSPSLFLPKE